MDIVQKTDEQQFVSGTISVQKFYESAVSAASRLKYRAGDAESDTAEKIGCPKDVYSELQAVCDPNNFKCGLEDEDDPFSSNIPDCGLQTTEIQKVELEKRNELQYRQGLGQMLKYKRYNFKVIDFHKDSCSPSDLLNYTPPDVLLTVVLMKPYNRPLYQHEIRLGRLLKMDSVYAVRGNQELSTLKDQIQCLSDFAYFEDYSEDPLECDEKEVSNVLYPSSFFYINGTFYNDHRQNLCHDLSIPIREWAKKRKNEMGPFDVKDMKETRFMDLMLRLGQPYLYLHQGSCEHIMVFTDIRLLHPTDAQDNEHYPMQISSKMKRRVPCIACKIYTAKWVVYNNKKLSCHPGFFCDTCFRSFHYNEEGEKRMEFEAVPYFDRNALN